MSGKLKANYQTGETQVILPADFLDLSAEVQQSLLRGWIQGLSDHLTFELPPAEVVVEADVAEVQEPAEEKPKRTSKKA